jgi:hypothetical protein
MSLIFLRTAKGRRPGLYAVSRQEKYSLHNVLQQWRWVWIKTRFQRISMATEITFEEITSSGSASLLNPKTGGNVSTNQRLAVVYAGCIVMIIIIYLLGRIGWWG